MNFGAINLMDGSEEKSKGMKLPEGIIENPYLGFWFPVTDARTGKVLFGRWVGSVEVVIDGFKDEDGWEYVTDYYLAYQTISGRIVYISSCYEDVRSGAPLHVHSLKGKMFDIRWGYYPASFPHEWAYCVSAPVETPAGIEPVETDELPF